MCGVVYVRLFCIQRSTSLPIICQLLYVFPLNSILHHPSFQVPSVTLSYYLPELSVSILFLKVYVHAYGRHNILYHLASSIISSETGSLAASEIYDPLFSLVWFYPEYDIKPHFNSIHHISTFHNFNTRKNLTRNLKLLTVL